MKSATKAALLSGLVFPGLGQLRLKQYSRGIAWMLIFCASLYFIVSNAVHQATIILDKVLSGDGAIDSSSILDAVSKSNSASESMLLQVSSIVIMVAWIGSIVDAYIVGKKIDLAEQSRSQK